MSTRKTPSFTAGFTTLVLLSLMVAVFGVYGWVKSDATLPEKWLFGSLTVAVAVTIPAICMALGKSKISALVLFPVLVLSSVTAYSTHHAYEVLMDAPRKAAYMASAPVLEAETAYATALEKVIAAQANIDAFPAVELPKCTCPQTIAATVSVWEAQRKPLADALAIAKEDRDAAKADLSALRTAYKPMAPDLLVWIIGAALDLAIAVGVVSLELTRERVAYRIKAETDAETLRKEEADADEAVASTIRDAANGLGAKVQKLREASALLRAA